MDYFGNDQEGKMDLTQKNNAHKQHLKEAPSWTILHDAVTLLWFRISKLAPPSPLREKLEQSGDMGNGSSEPMITLDEAIRSYRRLFICYQETWRERPQDQQNPTARRISSEIIAKFRDMRRWGSPWLGQRD